MSSDSSRFALALQLRNSTDRSRLTSEKARNAPVPVTMVAAKDLELIALREIRSFPGAEYVCHVEVDRLAAIGR